MLLGWLTVCAGVGVYAQAPINTARPTVSENSYIVPIGSLQGELGINLGWAAPRKHTLPQVLVRYGVAPRTELRLMQAVTFEPEADRMELAATSVGGKFELIPGRLAATTHLTLFSAEQKIAIDGGILYSATISEKVVIVGNANYLIGQRMRYAAAVGCVGWMVSARGTVFGEYFINHNGIWNHGVSAAYTWLISPRFQLDLSWQRYATGAAFLQAGGAFRLDRKNPTSKK